VAAIEFAKEQDPTAKEIAAYSSLSTGDVKNTLDNLVTVAAQHLQASESVTLDGFGTFRMVMKSNGKGVELPEKVSAISLASWVVDTLAV
jgi:predicted histone-like DNA-binding protein